MKNYILLFVFAFSFLSSCTSDKKTSYYLIRHSEKDRSNMMNANPHLNFEGEKRAQKWAAYFKDIKFDAVYSTKYFRTVETATPTAKTKGLEIKYYNPSKMFDSVFQAETLGKTVLVVGHSNTTPHLANKILGEEIYQDMDDNDNGSLFIVTVKGNEKESKIEKVENN
ncbi:phosphoglycerate mutase [Polaribacter reichenbachii]|uniref:Phosphoglycerate mutase n=1 Tax=Polaribacter reichenbachii TaxID=996801 RepID=A0A1B8U1P3_9FLAO|nr:phosphoglycerate mutase family protein [Polaribacter reichenbachii]APZ47261.1 phosphoglycerate mutase [Polaribacter reichenbachii]AUC17902.1 phosphoglycerate mutase [Polaribacter reichenbachii]OBY65775.1 phosphoglycerate mutase [Polaribacter reichenbachii]